MKRIGSEGKKSEENSHRVSNLLCDVSDLYVKKPVFSFDAG
jgi:hypothetical protein